MNKPVIVIGAGGHAKVLIDCLLLNHIQILGLLDHDISRAGNQVLGIPVLGSDDMLQHYPPDHIDLVNAIGSVGELAHRRMIYERMKEQGYSFQSVCHPSAVISPDVKLAEGVQVMAGVVIQPGCRIGCNTIVNTRSAVDHDCVISDHVHIAPGVVLSGGVTIGNMAHVGTGAAIIQGIRIEAGCLVAAGAVVTKDVGVDEVVMGIPARVVRKWKIGDKY